jgi:UDP-N-acetylglucosamine--N-acetylmuramyl-(pentapeptide) pyrophosphoryl-undecaprenol N-acetylglucosamine transferase
MPTILLTGGGTAGHVTPNLALIERLQADHWQIEYIGSHTGIEKQLISTKQIPYHSIATGKLRRYFSLRNLTDPLKISLGILQSWFILKKIKPDVVFSKGGFVAFPVVVAAWLWRIPIVIHESDLTPGLANKLSFPFASKICITFPESQRYMKHPAKVILAGTPIRRQFFRADAKRGRAFCGFAEEKKIILIMGGGSGSTLINQAVRQIITALTKDFYVVHLCGKGKVDEKLKQMAGYVQFDYLEEELFDIMAAADLVISRSGANALWELIALKKIHILIPLSKKASRGDQIVNAAYFEKLGISKVIPEEQLNGEKLLEAIIDINQNRERFQKARANYEYRDGTEMIYNLLSEYRKESKNGMQ